MPLIPFEPSHVRQIPLSKREAALADCKIDPAAYGLTLTKNGRPVAAGGFVAHGDGTARVWMILSEHIRTRPMIFHRLVKRLLPDLIASSQFSDVYLDVDETFPQGLIWAQRLGFTPVMFEGQVLAVRNAVTGRDHIIFRWDGAHERLRRCG